MNTFELASSIVELSNKIKDHYTDSCGVSLNLRASIIGTPLYELEITFTNETVQVDLHGAGELESKILELKEKPCDLW